MYLEKINSPKDIKKLSIDELKELIVELRAHSVSYTHLA